MGRSPHCNLTVVDLRLDDGTGGQFLRVSLKQAIEIHAKVLKYRFGRLAPEMAREKALSCSASNDHEGHRVWLEVAEVAESLLRTVERERWS
jgi:hypothetical protein